MSSSDPFRLKKVCANCPFRADTAFHGLNEERVSEIADSLREGSVFHCHSTLKYDRIDECADENGETNVLDAVTPTSQFCAGALATMEKAGEPNQAVRIAERLGLYDASSFDAEAQPVYSGLGEWEEALVERARSDEERLRERLKRR